MQIFYNCAGEKGVISPIENLFNTRQHRKERTNVNPCPQRDPNSRLQLEALANREGLRAIISDVHKT
jgi:hypothetical protein